MDEIAATTTPETPTNGQPEHGLTAVPDLPQPTVPMLPDGPGGELVPMVTKDGWLRRQQLTPTEREMQAEALRRHRQVQAEHSDAVMLAEDANQRVELLGRKVRTSLNEQSSLGAHLARAHGWHPESGKTLFMFDEEGYIWVRPNPNAPKEG